MEYNFELIKEKLEKELEEFKENKKVSREARVISTFVAKALIEFSKDESFGVEVMKSEKTLTDCCEEIVKDVGGSVSDGAVYAKAVQYYMPNSSVSIVMQIRTNVDSRTTEAEKVNETFEVVSNISKKIEMSLDDLF